MPNIAFEEVIVIVSGEVMVAVIVAVESIAFFCVNGAKPLTVVPPSDVASPSPTFMNFNVIVFPSLLKWN